MGSLAHQRPTDENCIKRLGELIFHAHRHVVGGDLVGAPKNVCLGSSFLDPLRMDAPAVVPVNLAATRADAVFNGDLKQEAKLKKTSALKSKILLKLIIKRKNQAQNENKKKECFPHLHVLRMLSAPARAP